MVRSNSEIFQTLKSEIQPRTCLFLPRLIMSFVVGEQSFFFQTSPWFTFPETLTVNKMKLDLLALSLCLLATGTTIQKPIFINLKKIAGSSDPRIFR